MRILAVLAGLLCPALIGVRVEDLVEAFRAMMPIPVALLAGAALVMPQRHALPGRDGG